MTRDHPPHGTENPGFCMKILGFSPHRGVTNRGARVDAAHARARERTTRDTGEDDPRDERRRVDARRVSRERGKKETNLDVDSETHPVVDKGS